MIVFDRGARVGERPFVPFSGRSWRLFGLIEDRRSFGFFG